MTEKTQQMPSEDPLRTQALQIGDIHVTQTIEPVQCPVCKTHNPAGEAFCVECGLVFASALPPDAFGAPAVAFPCLMDATGRQHFLRPGTNIVGRMGDVLLPDSRVSRKHAEILVEQVEKEPEKESLEREPSLRTLEWVVRLRDLGSTNGTKVNDKLLRPHEWCDLLEGDKVEFGGVALVFSLPASSVKKPSLHVEGKTQTLAQPIEGKRPADAEPRAWLVAEGVEFPLRLGENKIGRKTGNDIVLDDPYVSKEHARVDVAEEGFFITDLGSTNGTLINGTRLPANQRLSFGPQDEIAIGQKVYRLRLKEGESDG